MKLAEAYEHFQHLAGIKFERLFSEDDLSKIIKNKGKTGQLLELALGLRNTNTNLDFEDGELKSNKCDMIGRPQETIFITQISSHIDELIAGKPFIETHLYEKISNILYVPVCKAGDPRNWRFLPCIHIDLKDRKYKELFDIWNNDYQRICEQLKLHIETSKDGFIHTSNGRFIQVRSKDSKPYHPIYSVIYGRNVSNKNHAFYFRKAFVYYINELNHIKLDSSRDLSDIY